MTSEPECWATDAGAGDVASLVVPAALHHSRVFDIDLGWEVRVPAAGQAPWMELSLEVDGRLEWKRRCDAHAPSDGLEHHVRLALPPGRSLAVKARAHGQGVTGRRLHLQVREDQG